MAAKKTKDPKAERSKVIDELLADPEAFRKETDAAALKEHPNLTKAQLDASWEQLREQMGL